MKKLLFIACIATLSSCMSYTSVVGEGAKGNATNTKKNHYLVEGLIKVKTCDSGQMADGSENYEVHTRITFIDGLLWVITGGIYSPSTTTVKK